VGAWRETVGTEVVRNARDDRELAPKGDMESGKQSESGVEHGNDLCSMHKGLAQVFDWRWKWENKRMRYELAWWVEVALE
jgi:hypothetical protein